MNKHKRIISLSLIVFFITTMFHVTAYGEQFDISGLKSENIETQKVKKKKVSKITKELEDKRTENTKSYQKEDGSYEVAEYGTSVHYKEGGKWKDIDNTLKTSDDSNYLENKQNGFKIKISKNSNKKKFVDIKKDKYEFSWNLDNINDVKGEVVSEDTAKEDSEINESVDKEIKSDKELSSEAFMEKERDKDTLVNNEKKKTLKNVISTINFKTAFSNTDLQYILKGSDIKENIIINKYTDDTDYKFNLNIKNMTPELQKDNSIVFYASGDKTKEIFKINAPVMYDKNGETSSKVVMSLSKENDDYVLNLKPDKKWLKSSKRVYPVTIDPSVNTSLDIHSIHDTFVASNDTENKAQNQFVRVGSTPQIGTTRTYIKFDLPQLSAGDMITDAKLNLFFEPSVSSVSNNQVNVHKVNQDFNPDNLSWGTQPSYDPHVEAFNVINSTDQHWVYWDITSIAKQWYTSGNNYGLMLEQDNSSKYSSFWSDNVNNAYSWARPQVSFYYINNTGIENYWTYHTQDVGRAGTSYLNDYNGNLVFKHDDISMSGNRLPIAVNHVFNSNDRGNSIGYGNGWRLNLSEKLDWQIIEGKGYYIYTDEDGTLHYFLNSGTAPIQDELNLGLTLTKGNGTYTITDKKNNKINFLEGQPYLDYIEDANGNRMTCAYGTAANGTKVITTVTDPTSRKVNFTYNALSQLISITDNANRVTSYGYDGNGNLTSITYPDGKTSSYSYDGNHNLINATNYDGYKADYSYYGAMPYRVSSIAEGNKDGTQGDKLDISYDNNSTTFRDVKGRTNVYMFDNKGKTLAIKDVDGSAKYYQYGDTSNVTKLTSESKLQKTVVNLLTNHDLEGTDRWAFYREDGSDGTAGFSTEYHYLGNQSIKITKTNNTNARQFGDQWNNLTKGEAYTFSAYVKTDGMSKTNGKGAVISFYYKDKNGIYQNIDSKPVNGTSDWQRIQATFTLPNDATDTNVLTRLSVFGESGTAYFDSLQLEKGSVANRYNLIDNDDLSGTGGTPNKWSAIGTGGSDGLVSCGDSDHPDNLDTSVYQMNGVSNTAKRLGQSVSVSGKMGDVYSLGAWAKGYSVPNGNFQIQLAFVNGNSAQWCTFDFNKNYDKWQYISGECVAKQDYSRVDVYYLYENNANTAYLDGAQLYKEEFGQSYQYDSKGNVTSTADLAKQNSNFEYNGTNDLVKSADPKGNSFKYEYDSKHNMTRATTAQNTNYNFNYDKNGNPITAKIGDGTDYLQSKAAYTDDGNYMKSLTDSLGNTSQYNYDETSGLLTSTTDPNNKTTNNSYDGMDRLTSTSKEADGQNVTNNYGYQNDKINKITHNGFDYNFAYDSLGNNTSVSVGNQNLITNTYEPRSSLLLKSKYGNGQAVSTDYDYLDRKTAEVVGGDGSVGVSYSGQVQNIGWQNAVSDYSEAGTEGQSLRLEALKVQLNNALPGMRIKYQAHVQNVGWQDWVYDGQEAGTDNQGLRMEAVKIELEGAPAGYIVRYQVHVEGIGWMDPVSNGEIAGTVGKGLRIEAIKISVEKARYTYKYDSEGNLARENDFVNNVVNSYTYDMSSRLVKTSDSNGNEVNYSYDKNNNTSSVKDNVGGTSHETDYTYDADNKLTASKYGSNGSIECDDAYDNLARKTGSTINTGTSKYNINYKYLPGSQNTSKAGVSYSAHVQNIGWQSEVSNGATAGTVGQSLQMEALKVKLTDAPQNLKIKYQAQVQNIGWQDWVSEGQEAGTEGKGLRMEAVRIQFDVDPKQIPPGYHVYYQAQVQNKGWMDVVKDGDIAGTVGEGLRLEALRIYIVKPDVDSTASTKISSISNNGNEIGYEYDANENIKKITQGGKNITYTYNELNEVKREDNEVLNKTIVYSYDAGGNIVSKIEYPYTTGDLPAATSTVNYGYGDANWKDKLTNYNGRNITYDAIGNPLNDGVYSYTWEMGRQLAGMSGNGQNITYKYNDSGIRTEKTVNGVTTKYILEGSKVLYETDGTNKIYYTYDSADKLLSMNLNGAEYYYIRNVQGDVIGLIDKAGTQVVSYTYDTWGKLISIDGSLKDTVGKLNPYRYREYRYDTETGLYYLQSRYYNPEMGRFINADGIAAVTGDVLSTNLFAYCENNPTNTMDKDGQYATLAGVEAGAPFGIPGMIVGGIAFTLAGVYVYYKVDAYRKSHVTYSSSRSGKEITDAGKPRSKAWNNAKKKIKEGKGKGINVKARNEEEAEQLINDARPELKKGPTYEEPKPKASYEKHGIDNDYNMPHIKWRDWSNGKANGGEGHIFWDN